MSHAGLYKFYVTNWDGDWTLAIQIYISPVGEYLFVAVSMLVVCQASFVLYQFHKHIRNYINGQLLN